MKDSKEKQPGLYAFVLLSVGLHVAMFAGQGMIPESAPPEKLASPPIEVSFIESKNVKEQGRNIIVDVPPPAVVETPMTRELLSNANSRAHSNLGKIKADEYRHNKTSVPKVPGIQNPEKSMPVPEKKDPLSVERGIIEPTPTP